ncbi:hypothetical protein [Streptomyces sp. NPDC018693]|uniref:hypothetical protein n=1 Tax=unclassified Streptomyces TaxID=2593676 RepID=UPI0037A6510B
MLDPTTTGYISRLVAEEVAKNFNEIKEESKAHLETLGEKAQWFQENIPGGQQLESVATAVQGTDNTGVAASNQALYWSTQFFKFDPSVLSVSPNVVDWTPGRGFTFLGSDRQHRIPVGRAVDRIPGLRALRRNRGNDEENDGGANDADHSETIRNLKDQLGAQSRKIRDHDSAIRSLLAGQQRTARAGAASTAERARREERRATFNPLRRQTALASASELRQLESVLRQTEREAADLERRLAGSGS